MQTYDQWSELSLKLEDIHTLVESCGDDNSGVELKNLAQVELQRLTVEQEDTERRVKSLLLPTDPDDARNVMLEIRHGTGGDEACLWVREMAAAYAKYSVLMGWSSRIVSESPSEGGTGLTAFLR